MLNVSPRHREYETLPGINDPSIPALAPMPSGESEDTTKIVERFGEDIIAAGLLNGQQVVYIKPEKIVEVAEFIKNEPSLAYEALLDVTALDRLRLPIPGDEARFQAIYQLRSYARKQHLMIIAPTKSIDGDPDRPSIASLAGVYAGAIWPEPRRMIS